MGWTKIEPVRPHVCDKPYYADHSDAENFITGDMVRCDCGTVWICEGTDWGMQWDPYPRGVLKWKKETVIGKCNDR